METTLHATSHADQSMASSTIRPTLQNCIVPVAPTCFLLQASAGIGIAALTAHIHEIAKTYHAYGAANLTFIVSDALERDGFFAPAKQRALVGKLPIEVNYILPLKRVPGTAAAHRTRSRTGQNTFSSLGHADAAPGQNPRHLAAVAPDRHYP